MKEWETRVATLHSLKKNPVFKNNKNMRNTKKQARQVWLIVREKKATSGNYLFMSLEVEFSRERLQSSYNNTFKQLKGIMCKGLKKSGTNDSTNRES